MLSKYGIFCAIGLGLMGCDNHPSNPMITASTVPAIKAVDLSVPAQVTFLDEGIRLSLAKNAWGQFVVQLDQSKLSSHSMLRLPTIAGISFTAFQVLNADVDLNDAEYVRQTGDSGLTTSVPRVLLPLPVSNGSVDLSALKSSTHPILIWIDLHTTNTTPAGHFTGQCVLGEGQSAWNLPVQITVEDLTLPAQTHLHFAAPLEWSTLAGLYPKVLGAMPPRLLNRGDPRCVGLLRLVQDYLELAHKNKTDLYLPQLQPIVKWPLGKPPVVDWTDFDSVAAPWLTGSAFADHQPIAFWPLPAPDSLGGFDLSSQVQYWQTAADYFSQMHWLDRSPVVLKSESDGTTQAESLMLCAQARQILAAHPQICALLPLRDDQIQLASADNSNAIEAESTGRLIDATPGLVSGVAIRNWANATPRHWMNAIDAVTAAASEQGMRSLAWQAFGQHASLILCGDSMPNGGSPAKATQLIWAYPGEAFGVDHPLATVQLKWMRQAEQDFEYFLLAKERNIDPMKICRLETRPVELGAPQQVDPLFSLFAGNTDPHGCEGARQLLVDQITASSAGISGVNPTDLQTVRWFAAREKQSLVASSIDWKWDANGINAALNLELFNPAGAMPDGGQLQWTDAVDGWTSPAEPTPVSAIGQFQVKSVKANAQIDLNRISVASRQPMTLSFLDNFTQQSVPYKLVLPIAISERRQRALSLDGALDDWFPADAIQLNQPLVKMLNRPAIQSGTLDLSGTPTSIYTAWSEDNFYVAFRLGGVAASDLRSTRNFVQYDRGRAWGEDLCELLLQPIYIDNTKGPMLHVVCKPGGSWVEQQVDQKTWTPFEACGLRYASGVDPAEKVWRGEVAIPWKAIDASEHGRPALLRFNFIQHQQSTAESASWAGPIDQSRDGKLAGLLWLKEP